MAITHAAGLRDTLSDAVDTAIGTSGFLEFRDSGDTEVATLALSATAAGASSSGTITFNAISDDTSATGGTVAKFALTTSVPADVVLGAVATSGSDINMSSLVVGAGDTVSCSSLTYSSSV